MNLPFQQYFEEMPCYLTVQDRALKVITTNRWFREDFGDHEGRYCYQVYKQRPEKCEDCPVERTFRDGQRHTSEEQVRSLDGCDVSVIVYTTPIRDAAGNIVAVMEMSTDITEIKALQRQLRESQALYRMLFEEVPCFISIQDRELRVVHANRLHREAFGSSYGRKCYEVYRHRSEECEPCIVRRTFADGGVHVHEEVVTGADGKSLNVLVHTAPLRNAAGEIDRVIEISTDISLVRDLQSQLTSIGLLISSISHGIKGLLNGLDGGIYLVNSGLGDGGEGRLRQGWDIVLRNVERIRSLVMNILYYARDREMNLEELNTGELARNVVELLESRAAEIGAGVELDVAETAGTVRGDYAALRSLLVNLLENALDACRVDAKKREHRVRLNVGGDAGTVRFVVEDNGIGMEPETRDKAFSLFFSSKGTEGTGLGLFIANKIAAAHGGGIRLESEVDRGSVFTVELPREGPRELPEGEGAGAVASAAGAP